MVTLVYDDKWKTSTVTKSKGRKHYPAERSLWLGNPDIMASNTTTTLISVQANNIENINEEQ